MQRMHRTVGTFKSRSADDAQVAMLIHDFEEADKMLGILVESSKLWRDAWSDILTRQAAMAGDYDTIVMPIIASSDGRDDGKYSDTPVSTLERTQALRQAYAELKEDMSGEIGMVDQRIVEPAKDARAAIKQYKKVIKKREDKKLDFERFKGRVESAEKKTRRTDKENMALMKSRMELETATTVYEAADEHLKATLPGITSATYSLLPHLLNAQIMIQNTLLAQLYTTLHTYASDYGFPNPPPEFDDIILTFESDFTSLRLEAEGALRMLSTGKAVHQPMALGPTGSTITGLGIRNNINARRHGTPAALPPASKPALKPSPSLPAIEYHAPAPETPPPVDNALKPSWSRTQSHQLTARPSADHFTPASHSSQLAIRPRQPSATSTTSMSSLGSAAAAAAVAGKKKPPPPPPKKKPSMQFEYVTALYDFAGEGQGDLSFREGDRIRVMKKTESTDDWWEGELRGLRGSFPANYCR
ncbi:hypothetical protein EJ06DRAFT_542856 [Trichodelitschia bisporula]|uniref:SH3 domain signaling protein n=1 Tax=Trichodelitschia bisporula TaxID=703511 RepID=A0A6G1HXU1_9PEZI|nr:hypothetical protein EJ06DRAFT_542856 [Trichodelitschia bisporula]